MSQYRLERRLSWAGRIPIILLLLFSFGCFFVSSLTNFFTYTHQNILQSGYLDYYSSYYELVIREPLWMISSMMVDFPGLLARFLVLLYVLFLAKKPKALILVAFAFLFLAHQYMIKDFPWLVQEISNGYFDGMTVQQLWRYIISQFVANRSFYFIVVPTLLLAIIGAFTGYSNKALIGIPVSLLMVAPLQRIFIDFSELIYDIPQYFDSFSAYYLESGRYLYLFTRPAAIWSELSFFLALLILGLVVTQPYAFSSKKRRLQETNE